MDRKKLERFFDYAMYVFYMWALLAFGACMWKVTFS